MLTHEQENEYLLKDGTCWITVGTYSVFLAHHPDCLVYEIYDKGSEMDNPLHADSLPFTTDNNS